MAAGLPEEVILIGLSETAGCGELEAAPLVEGSGKQAGK